MSKVWSHNSAAGDVIYHLYAVMKLGGGEFYHYPDPNGGGLSQQRAESLCTLIRAQPYITKAEWSQNKQGFDLSDWGRNYKDNMNLTDMVCSWLGIPHPPREEKWLFIDEPKRIAPVVFNRCPRWHNDKFPWKKVYDKYRKDAVFIGLPDEFANFCHNVGPLSYYYTENYLEAAKVIAGCELFCGNQSSMMAVAEGLKKPCIQETMPYHSWFWNCHWDRPNKYHGYEDVETPDLETLRTLLSHDKLDGLRQAVKDTTSIPGDMAEVGVYKGGSAHLITTANPHKTLHLFDTFTGLPSDDIDGHHKQGEFSTTEQDVRQYLEGFNVQFHVGFFPETAERELGVTRFSLVHLDGDLYQTTKDAIGYFLPRMNKGGMIVLDDLDWPHCPGVRRAVDELLASRNENMIQVSLEKTAEYQGVLKCL